MVRAKQQKYIYVATSTFSSIKKPLDLKKHIVYNGHMSIIHKLATIMLYQKLKTIQMLENPKINIKLKLSALWTSLMAFYIYGDYFELYVPGKVENLINVKAKLESPTLLLVASILIAMLQ